MNQDYLHTTSATTLKQRFEKPISGFPAITRVKITENFPSQVETTVVEIPTAEIFTSGDWLARRFSGVTFTSIERWLWAEGYDPKTMTVLT